MRLSKLIFTDTVHFGMLFRNDLALTMSHLLSDESESVREACVDLFLECGKLVSSDDWRPVLHPVTKSICSRFGPSPIESCEEIRLKLMELVGEVVRVNFVCRDTLDVLIMCLSYGVLDTCPDVKKAACEAASQLPTSANLALDVNILGPLVDGLITISHHQHWRVRTACIETLGRLLALGEPPLASVKIDQVIPCVSLACLDHAHQVRSAAVRSLGTWIHCPDTADGADWKSRLFYWLSGLILDDSIEVASEALKRLKMNSSTTHAFPDDRIAEFTSNLQITKPHVHFCVEGATKVVAGKHLLVGNDVGKVNFALKILTLFASQVPGVHAEAVLRSLSALASEDSISDPLVKQASALLTKSILARYLLPILQRMIGSAIKSSAKDAVGSLKICVYLIWANHDPNSIIEDVIALTEIASYWPVLVDLAEEAISTLLGRHPALSDDQRWKIFDILLRCKTNSESSRDYDFTMAHLGPRVYDDFYGKALEMVTRKPDNRSCLRDILSKADVETCILPSLQDTLIPLLKTMGLPTDKDDRVDARLDAMEIINILAERKALVPFGENILREILIPNLSWRSGQANSALRKVALVVFRKIVSSDSVRVRASVFTDSIGVIKCCMDDSWSPDIRLLATLLLSDLIEGLHVSEPRVTEIYSDILKRLDDSHNEIRISASGCLVSFFGLLQRSSDTLPVSSFTQIVKALLVHLDDDSSDVASAVTKALIAGRTLFVDDIVGRESEAVLAAGRAVHAKRFLNLSRPVA